MLTVPERGIFRGATQVRLDPSLYPDMDTKLDISNEALRRLIREIDARPTAARLRRADGELLAQRLRRSPTANLRDRISLR
jgi:hypothetical protein